IDEQVGAELLVVLLDAREIRRGHLGGLDLLLADLVPQLEEGERGELRAHDAPSRIRGTTNAPPAALGALRRDSSCGNDGRGSSARSGVAISARWAVGSTPLVSSFCRASTYSRISPSC